MRLTKVTGGNPIQGVVPTRYYASHAKTTGMKAMLTGDSVWIEFYPKNPWKGCTRNNLINENWNESNDFTHLNNRVIKEPDDPDFIGVKDLKELNKLLNVGDLSEPVQLNPEFGNSIVNLSTPRRKRKKKWINEEEGEILPEAYITRNPQLFYDKKRVEGKKHRTNLVITAGGNCNISARTIQIRAKIYAKIIDELQRQGHNVGVHCVDPIGNHNHTKTHFILWEVKRHDEQMTMPQLQRDLGHSGVYRTAIFDIIASAPQCPRSGLGYSFHEVFLRDEDNDYKEPLKQLVRTIKIEVGEPTILLNLLPLGKNLHEDSLDKHLKKIQKVLSTIITTPKRRGVHLINYNDEQ
tara:strand:+ start:819 stop:1871 length:1053 start_codon:yes stop_codon:yes gene_type:complete